MGGCIRHHLTVDETVSDIDADARFVTKRRGARKAKIALARRLAVIMHRMWITNTPFSMERPAMIAV
jgi:hypothetical protein